MPPATSGAQAAHEPVCVRAVANIERASLLSALAALMIVAASTYTWLMGQLASAPHAAWTLGGCLAAGVMASLHARSLEARLLVDAGTQRAARVCRDVAGRSFVALLVVAVLAVAFVLGLNGGLGGPAAPVVAACTVLIGLALVVVAWQTPQLADVHPAPSRLLPLPTDRMPVRAAQGLTRALRRGVAMTGVAAAVILVAPLAGAYAGLYSPASSATVTRVTLASLGLVVALAALAAYLGFLIGAIRRMDFAPSWRCRVRRVGLTHLPILVAVCGMVIQLGLFATGRTPGSEGGLAPFAGGVLLVVAGLVAVGVVGVLGWLIRIAGKTVLPPGRTVRGAVRTAMSALLG